MKHASVTVADDSDSGTPEGIKEMDKSSLMFSSACYNNNIVLYMYKYNPTPSADGSWDW